MRAQRRYDDRFLATGADGRAIVFLNAVGYRALITDHSLAIDIVSKKQAPAHARGHDNARQGTTETLAPSQSDSDSS